MSIPAFVGGLARHGDAPALILPGRPAISYDTLAGRVAPLAERLRGGKRLIAVEAAPSEHAVVTYLAGLAAGHAVALLPPDDRDAFDRFSTRFRPDAEYRRFDGRWRFVDGGRAGETIHPDLSLLLVTSGSTGRGKTVRLSGAAVGSNAAAIAEYLELRPDDRAALVLPLHYAYGLSVLNAHLAAGASVWLYGGSVLDAGFSAAIRESGCTNLSGVPYTFDLVDGAGLRPEDVPDLRFMTVAGGRMAPDAVRRWVARLSGTDKRFFVMYGQTEAAARIAYLPPELAAVKPDSIGRAIPGGTLGLVDDAGRPVTRAETPGELVYRGPNVMMGYAEARADLARGHEVDRLHTGDVAVRDRDGHYRIVGRKRRMSKIAGVRVGHDALEAALAAEGIAAAVVGDDRSLLAVYTKGGKPERVRARLATLAGVPERRVEAEREPALPRLASGKIDYAALERRLNRPAAPVRGSVAAAFREVFFPHPVRPGDSFSGLGGDSLRHVQLSLALERALGHVPADWERRTIAELETAAPVRETRPTIGTDLVIRALAILLVVVQHATLWPVPGGAAAMVVLIGWNLARFQKDVLIAGDYGRFFRPLGAALVPYAVILSGYALAWETVPWASVFLVGNFGLADPERHGMLPFLYWFVEAYAQMLLVWAGLFLVPPIRRLATRDPFRFGLGLLAAAVVARFVVPHAVPMVGGRHVFTLPWIFYLGALGWCAALADDARRKLTVLGIAAVLMPAVAFDGGNWTGSWVKYGLQFAVVAALLHRPRLAVPRSVTQCVLPLAAASYHVYLFHRFVPELLLTRWEADMPAGLFALGAVVGGVLLGLAVHRLQGALVRVASRATAAEGEPEGAAIRA